MKYGEKTMWVRRGLFFGYLILVGVQSVFSDAAAGHRTEIFYPSLLPTKENVTLMASSHIEEATRTPEDPKQAKNKTILSPISGANKPAMKNPLHTQISVLRSDDTLKIEVKIRHQDGKLFVSPRNYEKDHRSSEVPQITIYKGNEQLLSAPLDYHPVDDTYQTFTYSKSWQVPVSTGNSDLRIVAITNLDSVCNSPNATIIYRWNILWSIGWLLFYPLFAICFLFKPNRNRKTLLFGLLMTILLISQIATYILWHDIFTALKILQVEWGAFAIFWLLGFVKVGECRGRFLLIAVFLMGGITVLSTLLIQGNAFHHTFSSLAMNCSLLGGLAVAVWVCTRSHAALYFGAVWGGAMYLFMYSMTLIYAVFIFHRPLGDAILGAMIWAIVFSLVVFLSFLPFGAVLVLSGHLKERFNGFFGPACLWEV